jgi:hypothetical protein
MRSAPARCGRTGAVALVELAAEVGTGHRECRRRGWRAETACLLWEIGVVEDVGGHRFFPEARSDVPRWGRVQTPRETRAGVLAWRGARVAAVGVESDY